MNGVWNVAWEQDTHTHTTVTGNYIERERERERDHLWRFTHIVGGVDKVAECEESDRDTHCWSIHSCYQWLGEVNERPDKLPTDTRNKITKARGCAFRKILSSPFPWHSRIQLMKVVRYIPTCEDLPCKEK